MTIIKLKRKKVTYGFSCLIGIAKRKRSDAAVGTRHGKSHAVIAHGLKVEVAVRVQMVRGRVTAVAAAVLQSKAGHQVNNAIHLLPLLFAN